MGEENKKVQDKSKRAKFATRQNFAEQNLGGH